MVTRQVQEDGSVRISDGRSAFVFRRLRPGALLAVGSGFDSGGLGRAPLDEVAAEAAAFPPIRLYFDLRAVTGVTTPVREEWTAWFAAHREAVRSADFLVNSKFVELAVSVANLFSRTGDLFRIHTDPARFEEAVVRETAAG